MSEERAEAAAGGNDTATDHGKDPAEQEALARELGEEVADGFVRFVRGEHDFAELTFLTYELLQDLHVVASGAYELEYDEDEAADGDERYDRAEATEEQEELAQEPAGP